MREIKFRAWNKKASSMGDHCFLMDMPAHLSWFHWALKGDENIALMQYTGLKDKNGKEIYEGDIVGFDDGKIDNEQTELEQWVVQELGEWDCTCGDYYCNESGIGFFVDGYHGYYRRSGTTDKSYSIRSITNINSKSEIIGNIYENPELLEANDG